MANYPDWVLKYKKKGTYINYQNGKYYLYAAHSERIKGTNKVRRVSDGYIGRITEEDGLIPAKDKVQTPVVIKEFGLSYVVISSTSFVLSGMRKSYKSKADMYYAAAVLLYIYGIADICHFKNSYVSLHFPEIEFPDEFDEKQMSGIGRGLRMITDKMETLYGNKLRSISSDLRDICLVCVNGKIYCPELSDTIKVFSKEYGIDWEGAKWQK